MMKYCTNCGKQLREDEVFCSECGNAVNAAPQQPIYGQQPYSPQQAPQFQQPVQVQQPPYSQVEEEKKTLATCALVFAFIMPIVGLILGIIGTVKYKSEKLKKQCIIAIPVSIVVWIINALVLSMIMMN